MPRGGPRAGAGRKVGSATLKTREIADRIAATGDTPLEALTELRRWAMQQFRQAVESQDAAAAASAAEVAADWAAKEAPYVHPKLSSIEAKVDAEVKATVRKIERVVVDPQNPNP